MSNELTTKRCDGMCARCDGAGTIPDWSSGQLPCPACKPMEGSEAVMAGRIAQSVGAERCPGCGAPISYRNAVWEFAECGVHRPVTGGYWRGVTGKCLRRQLVQAQERERELRDLLTVHERQQVDALAREARLRRLLDDVEWVRMLNDDGDVFEMCLFCDSIKERGHEDWCTRQTDLAAAPANPYTAVVEAYRMLVDLATRVRKEPENVREWLRRDGIVISDLTDKDQHAVFLMYNHLVDLSVRAKNLLESIEENDALADLGREDGGE